MNNKTYLEKFEQMKILQKELADEKHKLIQKHIDCCREELRNKIADEMMGEDVSRKYITWNNR
jgi:hypothetical protein